MKASLRYGDELIRYEIRRQRERRSSRVAIHVTPDGQVLVDAPMDAEDRQVRAAVAARAKWIHKHLSDVRSRLAFVLPREYVSGESLLYLGRRYRLKVVLASDAPASVRLRGGYIEVVVRERRAPPVRAALDAWYRGKAKAVLSERLVAVAESARLTRDAPPVRLQAMRVQWGSCSPAGCLTLNPHLVKAPRECIDYVLLHELCHLREHNHGSRFYRMLDARMPSWRRSKKRLDELAEQILR